MLDPMSQRTIVNRMNEERIAEARRDHLLRAAREERDAYETKQRVAPPSLLVTLASGLRSARHGLARHGGAHTHSAAAR